MRWEGGRGRLLRGEPPDDEQAKVEFRAGRHKSVNLSVDDAPNASLLSDSRRVVNRNGVHDEIRVTDRDMSISDSR